MSFNESQSCSAENENLKHLLSDAKNETIKCQQANIVSDNEVNDLQEQIQKLLELNRQLTTESAFNQTELVQINIKLKNETEILQKKANDLSIAAADLRIQNQDLLEFNEKIINDSFFIKIKPKNF